MALSAGHPTLEIRPLQLLAEEFAWVQLSGYVMTCFHCSEAASSINKHSGRSGAWQGHDREDHVQHCAMCMFVGVQHATQH